MTQPTAHAAARWLIAGFKKWYLEEKLGFSFFGETPNRVAVCIGTPDVTLCEAVANAIRETHQPAIASIFQHGVAIALRILEPKAAHVPIYRDLLLLAGDLQARKCLLVLDTLVKRRVFDLESARSCELFQAAFSLACSLSDNDEDVAYLFLLARTPWFKSELSLIWILFHRVAAIGPGQFGTCMDEFGYLLHAKVASLSAKETAERDRILISNTKLLAKNLGPQLQALLTTRGAEWDWLREALHT